MDKNRLNRQKSTKCKGPQTQFDQMVKIKPKIDIMDKYQQK